MRLDGTSGSTAIIYSTTIGLQRWQIRLKTETPEAGANAGSNFDIRAYADDSIAFTTPLSINRATGTIFFDHEPVINNPLAGTARSATVEDALGLVGQLRGIAYTHATGERAYGFLAEEVRDVMPEIVKTRPASDDTPEALGVASGQVVALLVNAVKELTARVAALEAA
jgi:hypothetical protein